jgi:hypothetical protein
MSVARQLPMPSVPNGIDPTLKNFLETFVSNVRAWIADAATHLGQFQDTPSASTVPREGDLLRFDGSLWSSSDLTGVSLAPTATPTIFTPARPLLKDADGVPQCFVVADGAVPLYVMGAPAAGQWTLDTNGDIVLGTAPTSFVTVPLALVNA